MPVAGAQHRLRAAAGTIPNADSIRWASAMTKLLLTVAAFAALVASHPARAADMRAPVYKALPPVYDPWTGGYVGINVGYSWGPWGASSNQSVFNFESLTASPKLNGWLGGFQAGHNWRVNGQWLLGIEGDKLYGGCLCLSGNQDLFARFGSGDDLGQLVNRHFPPRAEIQRLGLVIRRGGLDDPLGICDHSRHAGIDAAKVRSMAASELDILDDRFRGHGDLLRHSNGNDYVDRYRILSGVRHGAIQLGGIFPAFGPLDCP